MFALYTLCVCIFYEVVARKEPLFAVFSTFPVWIKSLGGNLVQFHSVSLDLVGHEDFGQYQRIDVV